MTTALLLLTLVTSPIVESLPDPVSDLIMQRSRELGLHPTSRAEADRLSQAVQIEAGHPPIEILLAIDEIESKYDPYQRSLAGARGIPQILPDTWRRWAPRAGVNLQAWHDLQAQTHVQSTYLRWLYLRYGTWLSTLTAYHRGCGVFDRSGNHIDGYARMVLARAGFLRSYLHSEDDR